MPATESGGRLAAPGPAGLRAIALIAWGALIALLLARYLWLPPPAGVSRWLPLAVLLPPLLLPARGLFGGNAYTFAWTGFVALIYFAFAIDSLFGTGAPRALGVAELAASLSLFAACICYPRAARRARS